MGSNALAAEQVSQQASVSGPFGSSFLNAALSECFGRDLSGLSSTRDDRGNADIGARASTRGTEISLGADIREDTNDLDAMQTIAHEVAHALNGGGSAATQLDQPGDRGEEQADRAGAGFREWAARGFEGPAPALEVATGGRAAVHRDAHNRTPVRGRPMLREGSHGSQVVALQQALNAHGIRTSVDGSYGPRTRASVMAFQRQAGIEVDGVVGPQTASKLNAGGAQAAPQAGPSAATGVVLTGRPALSFNSRGAQVSLLQRRLADLGAQVTVDGVFGAQTHRAVRAFQRANGLGVDGVVGPNTANRLNSGNAAQIPASASAGGGSFDAAGFDNLRDAVIAAAESHMGAPYYWGADGPGMFDCSGFVLWVLRQDTGLIRWGDDTAAGIRNRLPATNRPEKGDPVFYSGNNGVTHVEFYMGTGSRTIGASGGGSRTHGDDPGAKVQYGDYTRDRRRKSFGSISELIRQRLG